MRLGIFGGTFDPVHYGHLVLMETCRQLLQLDEVKVVPAGEPPHKTPDGITDGHTRADMLTFALSGCPEYTIDRREIRRKGKSFTVDTLTEIRRENPDAELFFLMGADSVRDLPTWKTPEQIVEIATIAAVNRPGHPSLSRAQMVDWIGEELAGRIRVISMPGCDLSASDLRSRIAAGKSLRFLTPKAVEAFINENGLYGNSAK